MAEYEIQLYGFSIAQIGLERRYFFQSRLNDVIETLISKVTTSTTAATGKLLMKLKAVIVKKIMDKMDKDFEAFEKLDRKYLAVPAHVLLESDFEHSKNDDEKTEQALDAKIEELQQLYLENSVMVTSLEMESTRFNEIKPYIEEQLKIQAQAKKCLESFDSKLLSTLMNQSKSTIDQLEKKD